MTRHCTILALFVVCLLLGGPTASAQTEGDAPEISRSVGVEGGVVLFWPRVVPRSSDPELSALAGAVQRHLRMLVERELPGRPVDQRPEPERVCPQAGCEAMTVGALIARNGTGCVVVALISGPGRAPARLIPWVGGATPRVAQVPFREPPESHITITDFAVCDDVVSQLAAGESAVAQAIAAVGGRRVAP